MAKSKSIKGKQEKEETEKKTKSAGKGAKKETASTSKSSSKKGGAAKSGTTKGGTTASSKSAAAKGAGGKSSVAKTGAAKTGPAKSGTAKSSTTKAGAKKERAAPAKGDKRDALIAELYELIDNLDENMLAILKQQAEIITYSQRRTDAIRKVSEYQTAVAQGQLPEEGYDPDAAWVEQTEAGFFMICVGRDRIFFNRDELRELARICWKSEDAPKGASRMFRWLERERRDFLNDTGIARPNSAALRNLYKFIISHYKVKE